jgi:hypothetical protein
MFRVHPILSGDSVNGDRFWETAQQILPVARQQVLNNATVRRNNRRTVFSMSSVPKAKDKFNNLRYV